MNDKVNTVVIGKLIKEELQRQGKTSVWLANELGCHRTNSKHPTPILAV